VRLVRQEAPPVGGAEFGCRDEHRSGAPLASACRQLCSALRRAAAKRGSLEALVAERAFYGTH
jgi:hypothetical protein